MNNILRDAMKRFEDDGRWTRYSLPLPTRINFVGCSLRLNEDTEIIESALKGLGVRYKIENIPSMLDRNHCVRRVVYAWTSDLRRAGL